MGSTVDTSQPAYITDGTITDGEAWVPLQTNTVTGSSVSSITLTSSTGVNNWSQYQDLVVVWYVQSDESSANYDGFKCRINNDSTADIYSGQFAYQYSTNVQKSKWDNDAFYVGDLNTATNNSGNDFSGSVNYFFDINAGKYTALMTQYGGINDTSNTFQGHIVQAYLSTAAVTSLLFYFTGDDINVGSRVDLFGVLPRMVS